MVLKRIFSLLMVGTFICSNVVITKVYAASTPLLGLPDPGSMVDLSAAFKPVMVKGLTIHPENPLMFDFIVSGGDTGLKGIGLKDESQKLIKYFLACLTVPESNWWVNLSPYENDKIVAEDLGQTDLGRDMLAQDYLLKQVTASLIYPEKKVGKSFWDRVYQKAQVQFGSTQVPVSTFNKVWVLADKAEVLERNNTAFVVGSHLKVMLDSDYLAMNKNSKRDVVAPAQDVASQMMRQIVLPELEREVNTGKNFAQLRQIYDALILANWYKIRLKDALLNQVYVNQGKVSGIDLSDKDIKEKIYQRYLAAYKKGAFNYIKEEAVGANQKPLSRKYFSGGALPGEAAANRLAVRRQATSNDASVIAEAGSMYRVPFVLDRSIQGIDGAMAATGVNDDLDLVMKTMDRSEASLRKLYGILSVRLMKGVSFEDWIVRLANDVREKTAENVLTEGFDLKSSEKGTTVKFASDRLNQWRRSLSVVNFSNITPENFLRAVSIFLNKVKDLGDSENFKALSEIEQRKVYFQVNAVIKSLLQSSVWGRVQDIANNPIKNELDELWNRSGLAYELERVEKVVAVTKGKSKDELSKGQVIFDDEGNAKWVLYTPDMYSPYEADAGKEIVDLKTPEMLIGLIKAHAIGLDSAGNIVLPEEFKGIKVREFMSKLGLAKLDDVVKLENDLRKTLERLGKIKPEDSQQFLTGIHSFNIDVKNKERSVQVLRAMIDLTYRLKIYFNWQVKKDRLAEDVNYQKDLTAVQAKLTGFGFSVEKRVLSASVEAMNIPIKHLKKILEGNAGGLAAINTGKQLLEQGLVREVPLAAGAASRYGVSLKEFSDMGWITASEYAVLKDLPRSLAAKWNSLGDTGVELMITNLLKLKRDGQGVSLSIAVNAATWDQILPYLYQKLEGSGIKVEVMMQNFGKAPLYDGKDYVTKDGKVQFFPSLKPLGHGNISGRFSDVLDSILNGRVYDVTHSADNPTSRMTDAVLGLVGAMSERSSAFGAIVNGRNIGQGGGGAVSINGVGSIIDTPIPNVENSKGFNPNRDINFFNTFVMAMNNVAALYAVSRGMDLISWEQVENISKGNVEELRLLQKRLNKLTPEQEFQMAERFNQLLPSNYVEKSEKVDGNELKFIQWEQISGEFQGALDKKIRERKVAEGAQLPADAKLGIVFVDISLQEWRLLTKDGSDLDAVHNLPLPAFAEVKTAVDLEIFSPIVEKIINEYRRRGVLPQISPKDAAMSTSEEVQKMFRGYQKQGVAALGSGHFLSKDDVPSGWVDQGVGELPEDSDGFDLPESDNAQVVSLETLKVELDGYFSSPSKGSWSQYYVLNEHLALARELAALSEATINKLLDPYNKISPVANPNKRNSIQDLRLLIDSIKEEQVKASQNPKISADVSGDKAMLNPGGIDFNPKNLGMTVTKEGDGVKITINPAEVARMKREGVRGFTPIIINIVPIANVMPLLGLEAPSRRDVKQLAGV